MVIVVMLIILTEEKLDPVFPTCGVMQKLEGEGGTQVWVRDGGEAAQRRCCGLNVIWPLNLYRALNPKVVSQWY